MINSSLYQSVIRIIKKIVNKIKRKKYSNYLLEIYFKLVVSLKYSNYLAFV